MLSAWRQLQRFANEFLGERSLTLSVDGRVYLEWLLLRGAVVIAQEDVGDDPDAMGLARSNIELLLATASGISLSAGGPEAVPAGLPGAGLRKRITSIDLRHALRHLPPLWPLTTRKRSAWSA